MEREAASAETPLGSAWRKGRKKERQKKKEIKGDRRKWRESVRQIAISTASTTATTTRTERILASFFLGGPQVFNHSHNEIYKGEFYLWNPGFISNHFVSVNLTVHVLILQSKFIKSTTLVKIRIKKH